MSHKDFEEPVPGEWERDTFGRKFRKIGHTIEYAPTIETTSGTFYVDELEEQNKNLREQSELRIKEQRSSVRASRKFCPFKEARNEMHTMCDPACVFFDDSDCVFLRTNTKPTKDTKGKYCPIARKCRIECALYDNGCALTCFGTKLGKE